MMDSSRARRLALLCAIGRLDQRRDRRFVVNGSYIIHASRGESSWRRWIRRSGRQRKSWSSWGRRLLRRARARSTMYVVYYICTYIICALNAGGESGSGASAGEDEREEGGVENGDR
jgi:hypothetical protein